MRTFTQEIDLRPVHRQLMRMHFAYATGAEVRAWARGDGSTLVEAYAPVGDDLFPIEEIDESGLPALPLEDGGDYMLTHDGSVYALDGDAPGALLVVIADADEAEIVEHDYYDSILYACGERGMFEEAATAVA